MAPNDDQLRVPLPAAVLDRYLAGTATADERALVEGWWHATSTRDQMRRLLHTRASTPESTAKVWDRIQARAFAEPAHETRDGDSASQMAPKTTPSPMQHAASRIVSPEGHGRETRARVTRETGNPWAFGEMLRISAIAVATLVVLFIAGIAIRRATPTTSHAAAQARIYATRAGQRAVVTLSDGSQVTLAPATTVRTSVSAETQAMMVRVDGEALFHVVHRSNAPFTVETRNAVTRVLGTQFVVRQYAADRLSQVVVTDGRVSLHSVQYPNAVGTVMAAHTLGTVDDSGRVTVAPNIAVDDYIAWTTGQLVFKKAPVRDIVADLGRAYGVEITLGDSTLAQHTLTWSIPVAHMTLAGALDALTGILDAHVVRLGNTLTIVPGQATRTRPHHRDSLITQEHTYGQ